MSTATFPRTGEARRQSRRGEVRARILAAALELFDRHGFANTSVESITRAADVAKGTFFNYFPSKESLLIELASGAITDFWLAAEGARSGDTIRPIVMSLPKLLLEKMGNSRVLVRSLIGAALLNPPLREAFGEIENSIRRDLARILAHGQELGEIRGDRTAGDLAMSLQHAFWGALAFADENDDMLARVGMTMEIFWDGIAAEHTGDGMWGV